MKYTIGFDMDNTICTSIRRNHPEDILKVKPRENVIKIMRELKNKGHEILIFTRRNACGKNARKLTIQWLRKHDIPYDKLITNKPHFDILIDDRAYNPHQSNFINSKGIEVECQIIRENFKKHTYRPRRKMKYTYQLRSKQ